jgi:Tfp pilus assembly protein PilX
MMKKNTLKKQKGFALLYTVVIVSLILSITAGISNIVFKQTILSSLATDSQNAFYQADSAVECGMYLLNNANSHFTMTNPIDPFVCGSTQSYTLDHTSSTTMVLYTTANATSTSPCANIIIDKTDLTKTRIEGDGFNICNTNSPRQIERVLEVTY